MNWETIIVALIAALGPLIGTIISNKQQKDLIIYRMDQMDNKINDLSEQVKKHNNFDRRLLVIETELNLKKEGKAG